jgi:hypothetical protein
MVRCGTQNATNVWKSQTRTMVHEPVSSWKNIIQIQYNYTGINSVYFLEFSLEVRRFETGYAQ